MTQHDLTEKLAGDRRYSAEAAQQIMAIAVANDAGFSCSELQEMAAELSVESVALERAVRLWEIEQSQLQGAKRQVQQKRQQRQRFYRYELLPYLVVNAFLWVLNIAIAGRVTWAIYPLLGWGLGLLLLWLMGWDGVSASCSGQPPRGKKALAKGASTQKVSPGCSRECGFNSGFNPEGASGGAG